MSNVYFNGFVLTLGLIMAIGAQNAHVLRQVGQQPAPGRRGPHRLAAYQQHLAELGLEQLDALRHRGLGEREPARRALESALLQHRLEGEQTLIDH